jgi:hypothetical protein
MDEAPKIEPPKARIIINLEDNGAVTPEFEGVNPYMAPTILRKVANLIEKQLIGIP